MNFLWTFPFPLCYTTPDTSGDTAVSRIAGAFVRGNLSTQSRYPAHRAFVLHVVQPSAEDENVPLGRAEHLVSGQITHFASWAELTVFIERMLAETGENLP